MGTTETGFGRCGACFSSSFMTTAGAAKSSLEKTGRLEGKGPFSRGSRAICLPPIISRTPIHLTSQHRMTTLRLSSLCRDANSPMVRCSQKLHDTRAFAQSKTLSSRRIVMMGRIRRRDLSSTPSANHALKRAPRQPHGRKKGVVDGLRLRGWVSFVVGSATNTIRHRLLLVPTNFWADNIRLCITLKGALPRGHAIVLDSRVRGQYRGNA